MKKLTLAVITLAVLCSCSNPKNNGDKNMSSSTVSVGIYYRVIKITLRGKTHEYIQSRNILVHYPDCIYCQDKTNKED